MDETDATLQKLQKSPDNETMFVNVCLTAVVTVLDRQYDRYFTMDINKKPKTESARCHTINAEEIMGMFSAAKDNAPNAKLNYLLSKAQKMALSITSTILSKRKGWCVVLCIAKGWCVVLCIAKVHC